jgi:adenylate cyclase
VARVLSLGMSHTADAVRRLVGNALLRPGDSEYTVGVRYAEAVDQLTPLVAPLLAAEFRARLLDGIRGHLITEAEREAGELNDTHEVAVAFADLVNYTRLGERLAPEDMGQIAGRLVEISARTAARPVALVKTIGDAAMFVSPEVEPLIGTLNTVVTSIEQQGPDFPSVRVGVAYGPATNRAGDWFGSTVNLASRITDAARPGRILATEEVRARAPDQEWKRKRRLRNLKGISDRIRLFSLAVPG